MIALNLFVRLLLLILLAMGAAARAAEPGRPRTPADLSAAMKSALESSSAPGASYAVFDRKGVIASGALGLANVAGNEAMTETTLMRAGSITKTLTALTVLRLIEQGRFRLDTPVRDLLPEAPIENPWEARDPIRVMHLLEHSAGFDDTSLSRLFIPEEARGGHLEALQADRRPLVARWKPGTMMSYANPGYAVLGALIEKTTGLRFEDAVQREVLVPLGMADSVMSIAEATQRSHARGYRGDVSHEAAILAMPDRAAGALWTTPRDLAKLGRFLLTDGASAPGYLSADAVRDLKTVHSTQAARAGLRWGYSPGLERSSALGIEWQGHSGGVYGAAAEFWTQPQRAMGFVVMVNHEQVGSLDSPLVSFVAGHPAPPQATPPSVAITGDVDGWYRRQDHRPELGAGINWLIGVVKVERDPADPTLLRVQELFSEPARYRSPDNRLLVSEKTGLTRSVLLRSGDQVTAIDLNGGFHVARVSTLSALAPLFAAAFCAVALLSVPFGRRKALRNRWLRRMPSLALLCLIVSVALMFQLDITRIGEITAVATGIFLGTLLMPIFALAGLGMSVLHWRRETAVVAKTRCLLGSVAAVLVSAYLAAFHWFALQMWHW